MSSRKVIIVDYKLGNLFSVEQACQHIGLNSCRVTSDPDDVLSADGMILPGVGAFGEAMKNLRGFGLDAAILSKIKSGTPLFGICLGLQLLFSVSEEFGHTEGLNVIEGQVKKFAQNTTAKKVKVPQIAWNRINSNGASWDRTPFESASPNEFMYFVHSYYVAPVDESIILSKTNYAGIEYCSSVLAGNIFATQFHPEKSGEKGLAIYRNWATQHKLL